MSFLTGIPQFVLFIVVTSFEPLNFICIIYDSNPKRLFK